MSRKVLSALLIICLTITMLVPSWGAPQEASAASTFTVRTSVPKTTDPNAKYYYSNDNRFWKAGRLAPDFKYYSGIMDDGKTGGYVWGNCTWWAYSRASEVRGEMLNPNLRGNAGDWWECNKKGGYYPYGQTPKAGSIVVYSTHVAFVEKVVDGQIYVSESGWQTKTYGMKSTQDIYFHYGIPWRKNETPKGYIYVTEDTSVEAKSVPADYSINISYSDLRMRSGPGTGYSNMGYAPKGTHQLKAVSADGEWGQLKSNGYWVCLDYTTKVTVKSSDNKLTSISAGGYSLSPSFSSSNTSYTVTVPYEKSSLVISATKSSSKASLSGTGTKYPKVGTNTYNIKVTAENGSTKTYTVKVVREPAKKVKVTSTTLNMRTGASTAYKSVGKIKPGTYTIVRTSNGWGKLEGSGYWICLKYTTDVTNSSGSSSSSSSDSTSSSGSSSSSSSTSSYKVKVSRSDLNMRSGPGTSYSVKGQIKPGTYTISETKNGWGKLSYNGYWIWLDYTTKVADTSTMQKVRVSISNLNMRTGPGTSYTSKGKVKPNVYYISETKNGWGKLNYNGYWIKLSYTEEVK